MASGKARRSLRSIQAVRKGIRKAIGNRAVEKFVNEGRELKAKQKGNPITHHPANIQRRKAARRTETGVKT